MVIVCTPYQLLHKTTPNTKPKMLNLRRTATKQLLLSQTQRNVGAVKVLSGNATHTQNKSAIDTTSFQEQQQLLARSLWLLHHDKSPSEGAASAQAANTNTNSNVPQQDVAPRARYATDESGFDDDFKTKKKVPDQDIMEQIMKRIDEDVKSNPIVLYMKGVPMAPQCGFSRAVVNIMGMYGFQYASFDMNADVMMKEALKKYSDWPTIPQLYVKGEFVGGCDIVLNMHKEGKLEEVLSNSGAAKVN